MQITCKSHTMPAYMPMPGFFFPFYPPLPRMWPLGNPSWNNGALTALLAQCSGWSVCWSGDDKSEGTFWSVFGTYARWSPTTAALNPNVKKNLYTHIFLSVSFKGLSPATGRLLPPCIFKSQRTHTTNHLLDRLVRREGFSQWNPMPLKWGL